MLTIGIDSGSTTTKGVLWNGESILKKTLIPTSSDPLHAANEVREALACPGLEAVVTTGYGRTLLEGRTRAVTEITCHAKGAALLHPGTSFLIDIGGQDCKAIAVGKNGRVTDFLMNDKCAAGTGRFIEVMMRTLNVPDDDLDAFTQGSQPAAISSMCTVFAESEMVSLLAKGIPAGDIALGIVDSICRRTANFAEKLEIGGEVFFSGGLARFECIRAGLVRHLKRPVYSHPLSQYAGALGAAILGGENLAKQQR